MAAEDKDANSLLRLDTDLNKSSQKPNKKTGISDIRINGNNAGLFGHTVDESMPAINVKPPTRGIIPEWNFWSPLVSSAVNLECKGLDKTIANPTPNEDKKQINSAILLNIFSQRFSCYDTLITPFANAANPGNNFKKINDL